MSVKSRIAELNTRLADTLTEKGVEADGSETTTALIDKVAQIPQGGEDGFNLTPYISSPPTISNDITEVTDDIVLHLERASGVNNIASGITWGCEKLTVYISSKCTSFFRAFRLGGSSCKLKEFVIVGDTSKITTYSAAFASKVNLERITGALDFSSVTANGVGEMCSGCTSLREIRIVAGTLSVSFNLEQSPLLSAESKQSIVDAFADMTGQTSITLTLHKDVVLTEEQKATLTLKNITLVQ